MSSKMNRNVRMMSMFAMFATLLGEGLAGSNAAGNIPQRMQFGGSGRGGRRSHVMISPRAKKRRKAKKRQENKSRAINAREAKRSRFSK